MSRLPSSQAAVSVVAISSRPPISLSRCPASTAQASWSSEARRQAADETELSLELFRTEDAQGLDKLLAEPSTGDRGSQS